MNKKYIKLSFSILISLIFTACGTTQEDSLSNNDNILYNCNLYIDKNYYEICYNNELKGALFVSYTLDGSLVDEPNIADRLSFYTEPSLEYSSEYSDYTGSGFDRGHLASDASFDWSNDSLKSVYSMANIVPQYPDVNRYSWIDTEYLEREQAIKYQSVDVVIGVDYSDNPQTIGENNIAVPKGFYKKISNSTHNYQECFYYENIPISNIEQDTLNSHEISCSKLYFD